MFLLDTLLLWINRLVFEYSVLLKVFDWTISNFNISRTVDASPLSNRFVKKYGAIPCMNLMILFWFLICNWSLSFISKIVENLEKILNNI